MIKPMSESKAVIFGCSGLSLTAEEKAFYRAAKPWGFILFGRNIGTEDQIRTLVAELRDTIDSPDAPVLIDQEGGRVQRIKAPLAPAYPNAALLGALYSHDRETGLRAAWLMSRLHAIDLMKFGINVDCLPVLDVPIEGSHDVIGNRAYGFDPRLVAAMGQAAADGLKAGGVLPVMKHIPGHGRAFADSHLALPTVDTPLDELMSSDFVPFQALKHELMAMSAHVVYSALDADHPATTSAKIIRTVIRESIGFQGLLLSDDVSMNALSGTIADRTKAIVAGGCDIVLHCNGIMSEMVDVARHAVPLAGQALQRATRVTKAFADAEPVDEQALRAEFAALIPTA